MSIVLDRLTKLFGNHSVVDQVSLELANGEFFVLLGSSGSGKSTILRLIAGLLQPDDGQILLHGRNVTHLPPQERGAGFVFQNYSIFRHMNVAENVEFGLKIRKIPAKERARRREQLLDMVGLAGLDQRYADQLSGGQLQRVALARALAYEPNVLLLDEPFGALDSRIRTQLRRSLKEVQRRLKVTTILVTHDQEEAFELADRIGVIDRGRILETGRPETLYSKPRSLFVATFLGAGTILVGKAGAGQARFGSLSLPIPPESAHRDGERAQVLFRPEQVVISEEKPDSGIPIVGQGKIISRTFSGAFQRVRVKLPHLPETRQVSPKVPFGEEGLLVDATVPAETSLTRECVWVGLRAWHILEEPHLRMLLYVGQQEPEKAGACLGFARDLSRRINAQVTLLGVAENRESVDELEKLFSKDESVQSFDQPDIQVRTGNAAEHLIRIQQDGLYDLLVLDAGSCTNTMLMELLECCTTPLLVARGGRKDLQHILICTAAGEPGKSDVRVGGRLARRLNASVTLLHVTGNGDLSSVAREHLDRASATLRGLDISGVVRIRQAATPSEGIVAEAREGKHDLIVVGGHGPRVRSLFKFDDVTFQVLNGVDRSVLVVPVEEE